MIAVRSRMDMPLVRTFMLAGTAALALVACGGKAAPRGMGGGGDPMGGGMSAAGAMAGDAASTYGPLEVGADWATFEKLNRVSFPSETHGGRMVDVYVNAIGAAAYKSGEEVPVGTVVVKTSRDLEGDEGPLFVMEKRDASFNPDQGNWFYAIHWAAPSDEWQAKLGGPVYWRTPSAKAAYCNDCHQGFDRELGGVPEANRDW